MLDKQLAGEKAVEFIRDGMTIGLGTGSTVYYAIKKIGQQVKQGLVIKAVSTSTSTTKLASRLGIPLIDINQVEEIDLTIDGADEVDVNYAGIKGGGGALFYEKIVASISKKNIWVIDSSKLVKEIGRFPLPIEVSPFGYSQILNKFDKLNMHPQMRKKHNEIYTTDSGNYIVDLHLETIKKPKDMQLWLDSIPGVITHGLFLNVVNTLIISSNSSIKIFNNLNN